MSLSLQLRKFNTLTHDVIFIDGLWGTGKSIIGPIVSGMRGVEMQKLAYIFEYLCVLRYLNKLAPDAARAMLAMYSDITQYHNVVGREVNLRWTDHSGPAKNPNSLRYLQRLVGPEGDSVIERINADNLAVHIMSHMILPIGEPLFETFGSRLRIVEVVRHPLYMVSHWHSYLSRFDGPREFTIAFDVAGNKVPWFAANWAEEYVALSPADRILTSIVRLYEQSFGAIDRLASRRGSLLVLTFEQLVLDPHRAMQQLEEFLGRAHHPRLRSLLRQQRLPRVLLNQGTGHKDYGWHATADVSEQDAYEKLWEPIRASASEKYLGQFKDLIAKYNARWPSVVSTFQ